MSEIAKKKENWKRRKTSQLIMLNTNQIETIPSTARIKKGCNQKQTNKTERDPERQTRKVTHVLYQVPMAPLIDGFVGVTEANVRCATSRCTGSRRAACRKSAMVISNLLLCARCVYERHRFLVGWETLQTSLVDFIHASIRSLSSTNCLLWDSE